MSDDSGPEERDEPVRCPVCGADFESVSVHDEGVVVNLLDNDRYRRVCFQPVGDDDGPLLRFFQHPHDGGETDQPGSAGGRIP